jgi:hypothetical protein
MSTQHWLATHAMDGYGTHDTWDFLLPSELWDLNSWKFIYEHILGHRSSAAFYFCDLIRVICFDLSTEDLSYLVVSPISQEGLFP